MNNIKRIKTPLTKDKVYNLKCGEFVYITGYIYTARDAAHKRLINLINNNEKLPFDLKDQIIYYVGPSPKRPQKIIGAAGPTTSYRMDDMTPPLLDKGLKGMIGKGNRNRSVIESIKKNNAVYFAAIGGIGAVISSCIKSTEIISYKELGPEAIRRLFVEDMPVVVAIDNKGRNIYEIEKKKFRRQS